MPNISIMVWIRVSLIISLLYFTCGFVKKMTICDSLRARSYIHSANEWHLLPESDNFDSDFANSISKPLPQWFLEQEAHRKKLQLEMEEKSKKMLEEFRAKYIVSEIEKANAIARITEERKKLTDKKKGKASWMKGLFNSKTSEAEVDTEIELTTQEKWEIFLNDEKETTGFYMPGFFEVFPELKLKWPTWAKRNGKAVQCETDADCQFPQACCAHPIIPGDKFCCTGWGRRIMVPAYQTQEISPNRFVFLVVILAAFGLFFLLRLYKNLTLSIEDYRRKLQSDDMIELNSLMREREYEELPGRILLPSAY